MTLLHTIEEMKLWQETQADVLQESGFVGALLAVFGYHKDKVNNEDQLEQRRLDGDGLGRPMVQ